VSVVHSDIYSVVTKCKAQYELHERPTHRDYLHEKLTLKNCISSLLFKVNNGALSAAEFNSGTGFLYVGMLDLKYQIALYYN
jgi:hypothetical protein